MISEYVIPFEPGIGNYDVTTTIAGRSYVFDARWNTRAKTWVMDISELDRTRIVSGVAVALGAFMGRRCHHLLFNRGVLVAQDLANQAGRGVPPTFDDFGVRVIVKYIPALDLMRRLTEFALR